MGFTPINPLKQLMKEQLCSLGLDPGYFSLDENRFMLIKFNTSPLLQEEL